MKYLTPQAVAAAVIGRGGAVITEMQRSCQAAITVSKTHELFPNSMHRVLTARAETERALNEVTRHLINWSKLVGEASPANESQMIFSVLVPGTVIANLV